MSEVTARISPLTAEEARAAAVRAGVPEYMADLNIFRILLRHPRLARAFHDLLHMLLWEGRLDSRLRELVIMRLGWICGSEYEWTQHWRVAQSLGISESDLLAVRDESPGGELGPLESALLAAADELTREGEVSAGTWTTCAELLGDDQSMLELLTVIATWRMVASILLSLEVPLESGVDTWPPEGRPPPDVPLWRHQPPSSQQIDSSVNKI